MKKAIIVMNESHSLKEEQEKILKKEYEKYQLHEKACEEKFDIVFVSPIPLMIRELTEMAISPNGSGRRRYSIKLFHNDNRIKKELPNGKIVQTIAETGWELV